MSKVPQTSAPLAEVIRDRWSPRSFDPTHEISDQDLLSILEAARWAPSAMNAQPWRFSVAKRGTELHKKLSGALSGLHSHQMGGIKAEKMEKLLDTPEDFEVAIAIAIGKRDEPEKLDGQALERELAPRTRLELSEIVLHGQP